MSSSITIWSERLRNDLLTQVVLQSIMKYSRNCMGLIYNAVLITKFRPLILIMTLLMQAMLRKILIFNSGSVPVSNLINTPGGYPSGVIAFLHSDLRTNFALHINRYTLVPYHSIPRTPWNKKKSKRERVLKRKYFKSSVQQSNSPTRKNISKRNSLLYSSIYFLFKSYIYTTEVLFCWTVLDMLDLRFSTIQQGKSNKKCKKCGLLDMLDGIQRYFIVIKFV